MGGYWNEKARFMLSLTVENAQQREEMVPVVALRMFLEHHEAQRPTKPIDLSGKSEEVREGFRRALAMRSPNPVPVVIGLDSENARKNPSSTG